MSMTEAQKTEALRLLGEGRIYKEIGEQIGATTESVSSFSIGNGSINNLFAVNSVIKRWSAMKAESSVSVHTRVV